MDLYQAAVLGYVHKQTHYLVNPNIAVLTLLILAIFQSIYLDFKRRETVF